MHSNTRSPGPAPANRTHRAPTRLYLTMSDRVSPIRIGTPLVPPVALDTDNPVKRRPLIGSDRRVCRLQATELILLGERQPSQISGGGNPFGRHASLAELLSVKLNSVRFEQLLSQLHLRYFCYMCNFVADSAKCYQYAYWLSESGAAECRRTSR